MNFPFVKGHGTGNDFVVLPDPDGSVHGDLDPAVVVALCDRRRGIGADGVLRVLRTDSEVAARVAALAGDSVSTNGEGDHDTAMLDVAPDAKWFMDYRNADGSVSAMCGNGLRVFASYLVAAGLVDPADHTAPLSVATLDGVKRVTFGADGEISVDMGPAAVGEAVTVTTSGSRYDARRVDIGNPHAVVFVDDLGVIGPLRDAPEVSPTEFPDGANVEFAEYADLAELRLRMRVHERGVGETLSCGTGACAVVAAAAAAQAISGGASDAAARAADEGVGQAAYTLEVLGGELTVTPDAQAHLHLKGPAVLVADGTWHD